MRKTYRAFSAGELSEEMYGRYDVDKYGSGNQRLKNFCIMAQGGVFRRPGMKFIAQGGKAQNKIRVIPFEFSTVQAYVLEFGHLYMRVFKDGGQVLESSLALTGITQASPGVLTKNAHGYSNGDEVYISGIVGMTQLNGRNFKIAGATANTFTLTDLRGNAINTTGYSAYVSGGTVARVYQLTTPYTEDELSMLYYAQTADVMTIVHPDHDPAELTRTGHAAWTLTTTTFAPSISAPSGVGSAATVGAGAVTYQYVVTAVKDETFEESLPSSVVSNTNNLATAGNYNTISWSALAGAVQYNIYKSDLGTYGFIGTSTSTSFKDDNIDPDVSNTPPRARNPFSGSGNKPSVVNFAQQRKVFAASRNRPDTIWMSRTGQYSNMSTSIPNKDDDAITFAIASGQVNKINHLVAFRDLLSMTSGNEWKITANGGYTPTTMEAIPETNYGSQGGGDAGIDLPAVKPLLMGNTAIFAEQFGLGIRDYNYTFEADGYDGNDLSVLSKHLFEDRYIVDWAFAKQPYRMAWAAMSDGQMVSLTYLREHKVWGLARQETDGFVESVCSIPDRTRRCNDVWFVVVREVDGQEYRYIERLEKYIDNPIKQAFFVDSGLSYDGAPITEVKNLWHLEGREVVIYADGNVLTRQTVTGGMITLAIAASIIHIGLYYDAELWPLPTEADTNAGSTMGTPKRLRSIMAQVIRTRGLKAGQSPDDEAFSDMVPQFANLDLSQTIEAFSGHVIFSAMTFWDKEGVAPYFIHPYPLPCKITSVTPDYA